MYIATGFVTLVHSYIQVTARSIDHILFIRALGVSMWKQSWLKCFNLNIPLFLIQTNFMKEIKKILFTQTLYHKMLKLLRKIKKIFACSGLQNLASLRRLLRSYFVTIIRTLQPLTISVSLKNSYLKNIFVTQVRNAFGQPQSKACFIWRQTTLGLKLVYSFVNFIMLLPVIYIRHTQDNCQSLPRHLLKQIQKFVRTFHAKRLPRHCWGKWCF